MQGLKTVYPDISEIIRLKSKAQQPVRAVKLELLSAKTRDEILAEEEISVMHMKMKATEYFSHANILISSNCCEIEHFRKNCTQKEEATCQTCGEKSANLKEHQCSGIVKCIRCGGSPVSNDPRCNIVRNYRAALTRNLLANRVSNNTNAPMSRSTLSSNTPSYSSMVARPHLSLPTR